MCINDIQADNALNKNIFFYTLFFIFCYFCFAFFLLNNTSIERITYIMVNTGVGKDALAWGGGLLYFLSNLTTNHLLMWNIVLVTCWPGLH